MTAPFKRRPLAGADANRSKEEATVDTGAECAARVGPLLIDWYRSSGRSFPWRATRDPYQVLIAVFMLQRTGVSQVMNVYERFIERYPDLPSIAQSGDEELAACLRPLGRVDRLPVLKDLVAALLAEHGGSVPNDLHALDALPGIGQYSARGILVLAYDRPFIMLDPNSYRVLGRACGISSAKKRPHADSEMIARLDATVPVDAPCDYNLALLDVGSTICRRRIPRHHVCPLEQVCWFVRGGG